MSDFRLIGLICHFPWIYHQNLAKVLYLSRILDKSDFCLVMPILYVPSAKIFRFTQTIYSIFCRNTVFNVERYDIFVASEGVEGLSELSILFELKFLLGGVLIF